MISQEPEDRPAETFSDGKGRTLSIYVKGNNLYGVRIDGKGAQPSICEGSWTGYERCKRDVIAYCAASDPYRPVTRGKGGVETEE